MCFSWDLGLSPARLEQNEGGLAAGHAGTAMEMQPWRRWQVCAKVVRTGWYRKSYCLMDGSALNERNIHFLFGWASTGLCELLLLVQTTQLRMTIHNSSTSISL